MHLPVTLSALVGGLAVVNAAPAPAPRIGSWHIGIPKGSYAHNSPAHVESNVDKRGIFDDDHPPFLENKYQRLYSSPSEAQSEKRGIFDADHPPYLENKYQRLYGAAPDSSLTARGTTGRILSIDDLKPLDQSDFAPLSVTSSSAPTPTSSPINQAKQQNDDGVSVSGITFASSLSAPSPKASNLLGNCNYAPDLRYLPHVDPELPSLAQNYLASTPNSQLSTDFPVYNGTGTIDIPAGSNLSPLDSQPTLSRDNGKGGVLNGQHIWVFADTAAVDPSGNMVGFTSSSVAVDTGMNGLQGKPITLKDSAGGWESSSGTPRGFAPMTEGEQSYTLAMSDSGTRYGIWSESAFVPLSNTEALLYAPIVFINAHSSQMYTGTGMTLLKITADNTLAGPVAERITEKLFSDDTPEWGGVAAVRSWGASGPGSSDGRIYTVGNTQGGLMLARCNAADAADATKYEFYDAATKAWSTTKPSRTADNSAHAFVKGAYATVDIFYSPRHLTWIMVFETPYADNKFYWRYLQPQDGKPIYPNWSPEGQGQSSDYVEEILTGTWSDPELLFAAPTPPSGTFVYGGGVHQGYFGADDITNGGSKMLLSWTAPQGTDAASVTNGYDQVTAVIEFA